MRCLPALVAPTVRTTGRAPLLGWLAILVAPAVVAVARGEHDLSGVVVFAAIAGGASGGFALHDPSPGLAATSVPRSARLAVAGAVVVGGVLSAWLALALLVAGSSSTVVELGGFAPEVAAAAGLSVAVGSRADQRSSTVGVSAGLATMVLMATSTGLASGHPALAWLPAIGVEAHGWRWWTVTVAAALVAGAGLADPARRVPVRPAGA